VRQPPPESRVDPIDRAALFLESIA
jgi:hypothetical protein